MKDQAQERARRIGPMIQAMRARGETFQTIADRLNAAGVKAARGGVWHKEQVGRMLAQLEALDMS